MFKSDSAISQNQEFFNQDPKIVLCLTKVRTVRAYVCHFHFYCKYSFLIMIIVIIIIVIIVTINDKYTSVN